MSTSLKKQTVKGLSWSLIDNLANQGITFIVGIVLARLLTPQEYGIVGIVSIFIVLFNNIVDGGFSNALIQKINTTKADYSTAFIVNVFVSVLLCLLLFFGAPLIGDFFNQADLVPITKVMSLIIIINAFGIIQKTILTKEINFKIQTYVSVVSSVISGVIGIFMAFKGYGAWSLVGQQLSRQVLNTSLLWIFNRWVPSLTFSYKSLKEMISFGWKLLMSTTINTLWQEINQVVIGKFYSVAVLGQFTRGKQFSDGVTYGLLTVIQRVTYPVLSSIQNDEQTFIEVYKKMTNTTMFIMFYILMTLFAISTNLIVVLIGVKWLEASVFLKLLCIGSIFAPLQILNYNILQIKRRTDLILKLSILSKLLSVGALFAGIFVSVNLMLGIMAFCNICIIAPVTVYYSSGKFFHIGVGDQLKMLLKPLCITIFVSIIMLCENLLPISNILLLIIQIITSVICVVILSEIFKVKEYQEVKQIIFNYLNKFRKSAKS